MSMFEKAARKKIRFDYKGQCSVEDLWDLSVEELDEIYQDLAAEQEEASGKSLLKKKSTGSTLLKLKLDVVKYIVEMKLTEDDKRKKRAESKIRKDKLAQILAKKEEQKMLDMSEDDLKAALAEEDEDDDDE